jgi:hypothetical protein
MQRQMMRQERTVVRSEGGAGMDRGVTERTIGSRGARPSSALWRHAIIKMNDTSRCRPRQTRTRQPAVQDARRAPCAMYDARWQQHQHTAAVG